MLLCSTRASETERYLRGAGWEVTTVTDGMLALLYAKRKLFRAAVLVSTDGPMDLAETALNLRDVDPCLEIVIVVEPGNATRKLIPEQNIANAVKNAKVLTAHELGSYLESST
jgi:hypothetical protein